jgi:hypothetical protein
VKKDVLDLYLKTCAASGLAPHRAFEKYLEETAEENDALEIVIQGNDKLNFSNRVADDALVAICATLTNYAIYIEDIDLRYNEISDHGAKALGDLIAKSPRLLGLNLQGNRIKSEGA